MPCHCYYNITLYVGIAIVLPSLPPSVASNRLPICPDPRATAVHYCCHHHHASRSSILPCTCGLAAGWRSQYPAISFSVELPLATVHPSGHGWTLGEKLDRSEAVHFYIRSIDTYTRQTVHATPPLPPPHIIVLPAGLSSASTRYLHRASNNTDCLAPACAQQHPLTPVCSPSSSRSTTHSTLARITESLARHRLFCPPLT